MSSPLWSLTFVPHGKRMESPLPEGTVVLDVGNGSPESGVFDHHRGGTSVDSTAELLLRYRDVFEERLKGQTNVEVITHERPDFDALTSFFLAWTFLSSASVPRPLAPLIDFASEVDQGRVRPDERLTLYTFVLRLGSWLTSEKGVSFRRSTHMSHLLQKARIKAIDLPTDTCTAALTLRLLQDWSTSPEWAPPDPIDPNCVSPTLRPILSPLSDRLGQQIRRCTEDIGRAQTAGDTGRMPTPSTDGSTSNVPYVRVVDPRANPSIFGKYLRTWSQQNYGAPVVSVLQFREAQRTIVSVPPESSLTLKGLGFYLERLEQNERMRQGIEDKGAPRYQFADTHGTVYVDPLFSSSDPWYDGRGHNFTIVDAPRGGTLLSLEEVYQAVVRAEWIDCIDKYESSSYQEWEALRQGN